MWGTLSLLLPAFCADSKRSIDITFRQLLCSVSVSSSVHLSSLICSWALRPELAFIGKGTEVDKSSEVFCHSLLWLGHRLHSVSMCLTTFGISEQCSSTRACVKAKESGVRGWWLKEKAGLKRENGMMVGETGRKEMRWLERAAVGSVLWQQRGFSSSLVASFFFL